MTTPTLALDSPLDTPLSTAAIPSASAVPGQYEVALNGHPYMIDHARDLAGFLNTHQTRRSLPILREQADTAPIPSEQSLNREANWRRTLESWEHGAGQLFYDRQTSDSSRFHTSKGVNCWTRWQLTLLNDTSQAYTSVNTNLRLTSAGSYLYLADGNNLLFTSDITASPVVWTQVTGTPATACLWITTDGYTVYACYGTSGVYTTTRGAATATAYNTLNASLIGYVKGRLMAAQGPSLYNITSGTAPAALLTQANSDFQWVGFAEAPGFIMAAGYSGTRSLIYKIGITSDGTVLTAPVVAGELPTGETVRTLKGYLGAVLIGSDLGVRYATVDGNGNLTIGALIPTSSPVLNFEPSDRYVWYSLTNYDATSTGLGRLTPTVFTQDLVPAWASDLMASTQGAVMSISTQQGRRVFAVSGHGVYTETALPVASGTLTTGLVTYGIGDSKVLTAVDLRHAPLTGTINVTVTPDQGSATSIGTSSTAGSTQPSSPLYAGNVRAEKYELTVTLTAASNISPVLTRVTLRAYPAPSRSFETIVPLILHSTIVDLNGTVQAVDVNAERAFLEDLLRTQASVNFQEGSNAYQMIVGDLIWVPIKTQGPAVPSPYGYDGSMVVTLIEIVN